MPTRLKRPSIIKQLVYTLMLGGFLTYMGYSVVSGQYGVESQRILKSEIVKLEAKNTRLQEEINNYKSKISLFDPNKLDPDILSERARELLSMVREDDRVIIIP